MSASYSPAAGVTLALLGCLAFTPGPAPAQEIPKTPADSVRGADTIPTYRTEEISVRVARSDRLLIHLPFSVAVVERAAFQDARLAVSLDESLRFVPGLFVHNRRNFSLGDRLTMRGLGARAQFGVRGMRVLSDGIPLTFPDGQTALTNLDLASAGRAEIIRGPASALYGNAGGGVISVSTEIPPSDSAYLEPLFLAGSYGMFQGRLKAAGSAAGFGYTGSVNYLDSDGFREHSSARLFRGNLVASRSLGDRGEIRALANFFRTPYAQNPSSLDLDDAVNRPRTVRPAIVAQGAAEIATQGHGGAALDLGLGETARLRAVAWAGGRDVWNAIPGRIIDLGRFWGGVRTEIGTRLPGPASAVRLAGGVDLELQRDNRAEFENLGIQEPGGRAMEGDLILSQGESVVGLGPFLQLEADLGARWTFAATGRFDLYRFEADDRLLSDGDDSGTRTFSEFSPTVGLTWSALDPLNLFANYSTAFQTPTTNELSNRPDGQGGFNPELEPERIQGVELGMRGSLGEARFGYGIAAFHSEVKNALVPYEGATDQVYFRNAGRVERSGVELHLAWSPLPSLGTRMAYTVQRLRFVEFETPAGDFSGNAEPGVPDQWLVIGLVHSAPFGLQTELDYRWVAAYPVNDANTAANWSSHVIDLRATLDRTADGFPLRVFVGIDNLLGERYNGSVVPNAFGGRYYEPAPGTVVYGGVSWPLALTGG
jgi:iron complex outermembrane receptor protein